MRGQPFLDRFYAKAEQFAYRLREEWGAPDYNVYGAHALKVISGVQGVVFVENAWRSGVQIRMTVDHVDLWNGKRMHAYDEEKCTKIFNNADRVWLWRI
jgi:hypothetical protein